MSELPPPPPPPTAKRRGVVRGLATLIVLVVIAGIALWIGTILGDDPAAVETVSEAPAVAADATAVTTSSPPATVTLTIDVVDATRNNPFPTDAWIQIGRSTDFIAFRVEPGVQTVSVEQDALERILDRAGKTLVSFTSPDPSSGDQEQLEKAPVNAELQVSDATLELVVRDWTVAMDGSFTGPVEAERSNPLSETDCSYGVSNRFAKAKRGLERYLPFLAQVDFDDVRSGRIPASAVTSTAESMLSTLDEIDDLFEEINERLTALRLPSHFRDDKREAAVLINAVKRAGSNGERADALIDLENHLIGLSFEWDELTDLCDRSR